MLGRRGAGVVALAVVALLSCADPGSAVAGSTTGGESATEAVILRGSAAEVEEGDRYTLTARITSADVARRVTLQQWTLDYAGNGYWDDVRSTKVDGRKRVVFKRVATGLNRERWRVSVTYGGKRVERSRPYAVTVWRWIPLSDYAPYYETDSLSLGPHAVDINGHRYEGWGPYSFWGAESWEARFTPGRHCTAFRGVLGVDDISADGSSGTISFTADDETIYTSPSLTPGMDEVVEVPLDAPYRFGVQGVDTSPDGVESWPVIGDPAFLCTGV